MKYLFLILTILLNLKVLISNDTISVQKIHPPSELENKVEALEEQIENHQNQLLNETISNYQLTSDRINNHLSFISIVATLFGVIIAFGGIFIGFESIKSKKRRDEALKTLETAKKYVNNKKIDFDNTVEKKIKDLDEEYQKIVTFSKERLLEDVNSETKKVKDLAEKKSKEIEDYSLDEKADKRVESLQKRIQFFENIGIPDDPKILLSKAKLISKEGMHEEAIELLKKVIIVEPENSDAHWQLGWEFSKLEINHDSIIHYQESIRIEPDQASTHNNLAVQFENTDKPYDALREYDKAISLEKKKLYFKNKIRILKKLNSEEEILKTYNELLELFSNDDDIYWELIKYLEENDQFKKALEYYDLAIKNVTDTKDEFNYSKSINYKKQDLFDKAIEGFQKSIENEHLTEHSYLQIADIKFKQNNIPAAIEIINSAISKNPKSPRLYAAKAKYQIDTEPESAFLTIKEGSKNIEGEAYYQSMGRVFTKIDKKEFANKLYNEANQIIFQKLSDKKEGNYLDYYEGLIILEKYSEAEIFYSENKAIMSSERGEIIVPFLNLCIDLKKNKNELNISQLDPFIKFRNKENSAKVEWHFDDILNSIENDISESNIKQLKLVSKLLRDEIKIDKFYSEIKITST